MGTFQVFLVLLLSCAASTLCWREYSGKKSEKITRIATQVDTGGFSLPWIEQHESATPTCSPTLTASFCLAARRRVWILRFSGYTALTSRYCKTLQFDFLFLHLVVWPLHISILLLVDCSNLQNTRLQYFTVWSLKEPFECVDSRNITDFIKVTHFCDRLQCLLFIFYSSQIVLPHPLYLTISVILIQFHLSLLYDSKWPFMCWCANNNLLTHSLTNSLSHTCLPSARQHPSYGDCLEVKRKYHQNCSVLDCVTQCSQSAAHLCEQFLQVKQIGFV